MNEGSILVCPHERSIQIGFVSEKNYSVQSVRENELDFASCETEHGCNHQWLNEAIERVFVWGTAVWVSLLLEISKKNNLGIAGESKFILACEISVKENDLIFSFGVWYMGFGEEGVVLWTEVSDTEFVFRIIDLLLKSVARSDKS